MKIENGRLEAAGVKPTQQDFDTIAKELGVTPGFAVKAGDKPVAAMNIVDAATKFKKGLHPECGSTGEYDIFDANAILLKMIGVEVEDATEEDIKDFNGIKLKDGAKVFIHPSFGVTMKEIQDKFEGVNKISKNSILWLQGENTHVKDLDLDSTLVASEDSKDIEGDFKEKKYVEYKPLDSSDNLEDLNEVIKIRGFRLLPSEDIEGLSIISQ